MNRKGESQLLNLIGGVVLIVVFGLGFIYMLGGGQQAYPNVIYNSTQYNSINQSAQIINLTEETQKQFIQFNNTGTSDPSIITVITTGGYNTLKIIGNIPSIYSSIIGGAAAVIGIPVAVTNLLFFFIVAIVITVFIALVFRVSS